MRTARFVFLVALGSAIPLVLTPACSDELHNCDRNPKLLCGRYAPLPGGNGGSGAGGGTAGTGGSIPCGGCSAPTPLCDEGTNTCVGCLGDSDCLDPAAARCNAGACAPCAASANCQHLAATTACDAGTCVECFLGEEGACGAGTTCDLLAKSCTGAAPTSVQNCGACTNDLQCLASHRCIQLDFAGSPHGYYCLREPPPICARPFTVPINKPSISGTPATNYCGINEDLATCEAVIAVQSGWVCSGTDGMCGPDQQPEVSVPGAICRAFGPGGIIGDFCTYACDSTNQCPPGAPENTCGTGAGVPPGWCGGG